MAFGFLFQFFVFFIDMGGILYQYAFCFIFNLAFVVDFKVVEEGD